MARKETGQLFEKNGQFYGRFWTHVDGERVRVTRALGTANRAAARVKLDRMRAEGVAAIVDSKRSERLSQAVERIYAERIAVYYDKHPGVRPTKGPREELRSLQRYAFPVIGSMAIDAVAGTDVNSVLDAVKHAGKSAATARHMRERLSSVFSDLRRAGLVRANPVHDCAMPRFERVAKRERAVLTDHELAIYLAWQHPIDRFRGGVLERQTMACVSRLFGGVRTGDLHALRWDDFDVEHGAFAWGYAPRQKTKQPQRLEVPELLRPLLHDYWERAGRPQLGLLFPTRIGERVGEQRRSFSHAESFRRDLQAAFRAAPAEVAAPRPGSQRWAQLFEEGSRTRPVDFHSWRRAYVQALADADVNAQQAAALAGHASLAAHAMYLGGSDRARRLPAGALPNLQLTKGHPQKDLLASPGVTPGSEQAPGPSDFASLAIPGAGPGAFEMRSQLAIRPAKSFGKLRLWGAQKAPRAPFAAAVAASGPGYTVLVFAAEPASTLSRVRAAIETAMEAAQ